MAQPSSSAAASVAVGTDRGLSRRSPDGKETTPTPKPTTARRRRQGDDDDGDSDEHGDDWLKKASVQELEERAERADPGQANEYEREGLDDDDESDGEEDYVPGGGGEQQVEYVIAIATYDRAKMFATHTYPLLVKHGLTAKATLFLQSEEDAIAYAHFGLNTVMGPRGRSDSKAVLAQRPF